MAIALQNVDENVARIGAVLDDQDAARTRRSGGGRFPDRHDCLSSTCDGHSHRELAAGSQTVTPGLHRAALHLDEPPHDRESEAQATVRTIERRRPLHEQFERMSENVIGHPLSVVAHADDGRSIFLRRAHGDRPTFPRELRRVVNEIGDRLGEPHRIDIERDRFTRHVDRDVLSPLLDQMPPHIDRLGHHLRQRDAPPLERDDAARDARDVEQIIDETPQMTRLPADDLPRLFRVGAVG